MNTDCRHFFPIDGEHCTNCGGDKYAHPWLVLLDPPLHRGSLEEFFPNRGICYELTGDIEYTVLNA